MNADYVLFIVLEINIARLHNGFSEFQTIIVIGIFPALFIRTAILKPTVRYKRHREARDIA